MKKLIIFACLFFAMLLTFASSTQAQTKKKGISSQGKGAIIGGAGGALIGGVASHSVGGAVIGGAIGAGGGYIIGNEARRAKEKKERARRIAWRKAHPRHHRPYSKTTTVTTVKYQ